MKIYFLIYSPYPYYSGGIENWLFNVSQRLSEEYDVYIVAHERKEYPVLYPDISDSIKMVKFRTLRSFKVSNRFIRSYLVLFDLFLGSFLMGKALKRVLPKDETCFIVALDSIFCLNAGLFAKSKNTKIKVISSVRGPHAEILGKSYPIFFKKLLSLERNSLHKANQIWANGYDTMESLEKKGFSSILMKNGFDYKGLSEIEVEDSHFDKLVQNKITVVSVGTLLPIKGVYELLDAAEILINEKNVNVHLIFIGKGNKDNFHKYAKKKGILGNTHFIGYKSNPIRYVKKCTISACLSGGGGMSMVAIESMASGVPIVAWDSPVYRQFNRSKNVMLLVAEKSIEALVMGIMKIVNNYDYYRDIGEKAKLEAEHYDWSVICKQIEENFKNDC